MIRYRFLFCIWLLVWFLVWVFGNSNIGFFILLATAFCTAVEILISFLGKKQVSVQISGETTVPKNVQSPVTVTVSNQGFFDCAKVEVALLCRNLLTGEEVVKTLQTPVGRKSAAAVTVPICWSTCGKIQITMKKICVYDIFGLKKSSINNQEKMAVLVLPELFPVEILMGQQLQLDLSSEEYSMLRAGDDPSETFALREYRPGDKIKNIHWKLSEKLDGTVVRELGMPVNNALLLLLDNSAVGQMPNREVRELLGESVVSVSATLIQRQITHDVAWLDRENNEVTLCHVTSDEDMGTVLAGVLSAQIEPDSRTVPERFVDTYDLSAFAHVLVITTNLPGDTDFWGNTGITYLTPSIADKEGLYVEI